MTNLTKIYSHHQIFQFSPVEVTTFMQVPDYYFMIIDDEQRPRRLSPNWCRLLGCDSEELAFSPLNSFIHPEDLAEFLEFLEKLSPFHHHRLGGTTFNLRLLKSNKDILWMQVNATKSEDGLYSLIFHDISQMHSTGFQSQPTKSRSDLIEEFTETELQIFTFLSQNEGECVTKQDIYKHLYGEIKVQDQTINVHISNLRKKIKTSAYTLKTVGKGRWKLLNKYRA